MGERPLPDGHRFGFPRTQRIRKRAEFVRIQEGKTRIYAGHLVVLLERRADDGPPRLGVVASRKVGPAVARNRAKRLVREAFRLLAWTLPRGVDLVMITRPGTPELGLDDVKREIAEAAPALGRRAKGLRRPS